jgi:hypothetical protein
MDAYCSVGMQASILPPPTTRRQGGMLSSITYLGRVRQCSFVIAVEEIVYNEHHPDFFLLAGLGQQIAKLWALRLKLDFPLARLQQA